MSNTQATPGQFWEMAKALVDRLPKDGSLPYNENPAWYNQQVGQLVRLPSGSDAARQIEAVLNHGPLLEANPYAKERVEQKYFYPEGWAPKSWEEQLRTLREIWGEELDASHVEALAGEWEEAPEEADGLFVVPKLSALARVLGIEDPYGAGYSALVARAVEKLADARSFHNYLEGKLTSEHLRLTEHTRAHLQRLEEETPGDFLVLPAQTGQFYAGYSPRNARWEIEHPVNLRTGRSRPEDLTEVGMYAFAMGNLLLTHPERLAKYEHLAIDCPGDEFRWGRSGAFGRVPSFGFGGGKLRLDDGRINYPNFGWGSASVFLRSAEG